MLKLTLTALNVMPIPSGAPIPHFRQLLDAEQKTLNSNELIEKSARQMLDQLARWAGALKALPDQTH